MMHVINGVLYFDAHDGNSGKELWKHDPSTGTTSRVYDINAGGTGSATGKWLNMVVGDVLYFSANDGSTDSELWAYNTSNSSNPWRVMDINSGGTGSEPGMLHERACWRYHLLRCWRFIRWQRTVGTQHFQPVHMAGGGHPNRFNRQQPGRPDVVAGW